MVAARYSSMTARWWRVGTPTGPGATRGCMDCDHARMVLSAQLDQEADEVEAVAANAHLGRCAGCRSWWSDVGRATRALRVRMAEPIPDLASAVLARAHPPRAGRRQWVRWTLAAVAATELAMAIPGLVVGDGAAAIHDARHIGSFGSAVAIGLLYVAWRPARAFGILPIVAALAATMLFTAVTDTIAGRVTTLGEAHHVLEVAGLILVWMLAGRPAPRRLRPLVDPSHPSYRLRHT